MKQRYPLPVALACIAPRGRGASPRGVGAPALLAGQCLAMPATYIIAGLLRAGQPSGRATATPPAQPGGPQPAFY